MLSGLGRELFFPKGILTQSAEAERKAHRFNATIGIATEGGTPMHLPGMMRHFRDISPDELFPYAPTTGLPELRRAWLEHLFAANPRLRGKEVSVPIVTSGITHGLSLAADLFFNAGDMLILPDKIWGNYRLTFGVRKGVSIVSYPLFNKRMGFNLDGLANALTAARPRGKAGVILNFPNNPTGYTPTRAEAEGIASLLLAHAEDGLNLVTLIDDAYFGLFYGDSPFRESAFGLIAGSHPRLLALKLDGATKEDFAWGFRVGFVTLGCGGNDLTPLYGALEKKLGGAIRGDISNCSRPGQALVLRALGDEATDADRERNNHVLAERAARLHELLEGDRYRDAWEAYPFNSGYFMCLRLKHVDAEQLRVHLLHRYGIGVIAVGDSDIRIAFSCIEREDLEELFDMVYNACDDLRLNATS